MSKLGLKYVGLLYGMLVGLAVVCAVFIYATEKLGPAITFGTLGLFIIGLATKEMYKTGKSEESKKTS